ncbi:MAG: RHS repeat-associated core domain-containing protein [Campylobacterales bacterium]|nr:RHS repeat-associated core domain-containing protein [Campylobacterales bacterium]
MEYLPFGETLADEHLNSINSPFKYNGKELDEETGNYYYGARYYDPKWSIFISVDPLVDKTRDAYGYCYQNPINLVDPTGMEGNGWITTIDENGKKTHTYNNEINTVEEAESCVYNAKQVENVRKALTVSARDGSYTYNLNEDGSVTDADGNVVKGDALGSFETTGGSTIQSYAISTYDEKTFQRASGAFISMEFSSPFFPVGAIMGNAFKGLSQVAPRLGRVFWSGGELAKTTAGEYAVANGLQTLEMTTAGKALNAVSPNLPRKITSPL